MRFTLSTVACFQPETLLKNELFKGFHGKCSVAINYSILADFFGNCERTFCDTSVHIWRKNKQERKIKKNPYIKIQKEFNCNIILKLIE